MYTVAFICPVFILILWYRYICVSVLTSRDLKALPGMGAADKLQKDALFALLCCIAYLYVTTFTCMVPVKLTSF